MKQTLATRLLMVLCSLPVFLLSGCIEETVKEAPVASALFYPPLPNPPRIQYLASFSGASDLAEAPGAFGKFILGNDVEDKEGIKKPYGVDMFANRIYATDTRGAGYVVFDLEKQSYKTVVGSMGGALPKPINITIDDDGTKYITDTSRNQIVKFDADDHFVEAFGVEQQFKPGDVVVAGDRLYVADLDHHNIHVLDKGTGKALSTFSKVGATEGSLYYPTNLAVGPDNLLYVSDTGNFRVQAFTLDGKFVKSIGSVGTGLGHFARPKGISVDRDGRLYVVDAAFENIQVFNKEGKLLLFFGEPAANHRAGLDLPTDLNINYEGAAIFQKYADPKFKLEYVILVANQFGRNKITVFGYGRMEGMDYSVE